MHTMAKAHNRSALRDAAVALVKAMPNAQNRTLARRLAKEFSTTIENARTVVRTVKGVKGDRDTAYAEVPSPKGKAGWKPAMPPSQAEPWEPFDMNAKRILILSDEHVPYHSERALNAAVAYAKKMKPDAVLLNGDSADFYTISRWETNPKKRDLQAELKSQIAYTEWIASQFPSARKVRKKGNHCERWDSWLWNRAPEICDMERMSLESWLEYDKHGFEMVGDKRPVMCGKLPVFHGHELGRSGISNPVNPARGAFLRTHHSVLVAHSHQTSGHADTNLWHEETFVWSTGCLCDLTPDYARINRWNHGFSVVDVSTDGSFDVLNLRINSDGQVRRS
jgi:hypothetical protein